jgi:putative hydrolase of the HAD superfamily
MEEGGPLIRGVIFDFGNVISAFDVGKFLRRLCGWSGTGLETLRDRIYGSGLHSRYERGEISSEEFHREISRISGARVPAEEFAEAFTDIFTPLESTQRLVRSLKGKYRLGLLSNTNEWHFERHIRNVPVFPLFDAVTLSYEVRALKPSPEIYRDALRKLSLPPEACVFIDDIREYAEGASALGIRGIRYTGHDDLLRALADLRVSVP